MLVTAMSKQRWGGDSLGQQVRDQGLQPGVVAHDWARHVGPLTLRDPSKAPVGLLERYRVAQELHQALFGPAVAEFADRRADVGASPVVTVAGRSRQGEEDLAAAVEKGYRLATKL
jgi:hypothetical protein